jgi:hypothetical protein
MVHNEINTLTKEPAMDIDIPTAEIDLIEDDLELEPFPWGKEIAKELTLSTATTAGVAGGFVVFAFAFMGISELRKRFAKKSTPEAPVITDLPAPSET